MKRSFSLSGLCVALVIFHAPALPAANTNALVKTWETQVVGPGLDRTTCFLTFSNDLTWTGYGIALKSFGPVALAGTWGIDSKDRIIGGFTEFRPALVGDIAGTLKKLAASQNHVRGRGVEMHRIFHVKGTALSTLRDVSGSNWVGRVHSQGNTSFQVYTLTASTNLPGWFDITGSGFGHSGTYAISGGLVVASDRRANGYLVSDFGSVGTTSTWSFAGRFLPSLERVVFHGRQDTGQHLVIRATKQ
jgi:hypothetical protein